MRELVELMQGRLARLRAMGDDVMMTYEQMVALEDVRVFTPPDAVAALRRSAVAPADRAGAGDDGGAAECAAEGDGRCGFRANQRAGEGFPGKVEGASS
jgi:hypothetical protein